MDDIFITKEAAKYLKVSQTYTRLNKLGSNKKKSRNGHRDLKENNDKFIKEKLQKIT